LAADGQGQEHEQGQHEQEHEKGQEHEQGQEYEQGQGYGPARGQGLYESAGPQPSRGDKRLYFVLMAICIGFFVLSWAVVDRYSVTAAVIISVVALVIPPFAAIIANVASAADRRRP
jgi:hypothetical protein